MLYRIISNHKKNYMDSHGVYPVYEAGEAAYYKRSPRFLSLLEKYEITYRCIPNRIAK